MGAGIQNEAAIDTFSFCMKFDTLDNVSNVMLMSTNTKMPCDIICKNRIQYEVFSTNTNLQDFHSVIWNSCHFFFLVAQTCSLKNFHYLSYDNYSR
jgi:hypothetical protein